LLLFYGCTQSGYEQTISGYFSSIEDQDYDAFLSFTDIQFRRVPEEAGHLGSTEIEGLKEKYGDDLKLEYSVIRGSELLSQTKKTVSIQMYELNVEALSSYYTILIEDYISLEISLKISGSKQDTPKIIENASLGLVKLEGNWYVEGFSAESEIF
jgi:hypothetical protein